MKDSSWIDTSETSDESLISWMNWPASGGSTLRSACGSTMKRTTSIRDMPRLSPASICAFGTD